MIYAISIRNFVTFTNRLWVGFHFLSLVYRFGFQNFREFRRKFVWKLCEYGSPAGVRMPIKNRIYVWTVFSAPVLKENYHQQVPSAWNYLTEKKGRKPFWLFLYEQKTNVLRRTVAGLLSESETNEESYTDSSTDSKHQTNGYGPDEKRSLFIWNVF